MTSEKVSEESYLQEFKEHYFGVEFLETESLFVDDSYQRPVKKALVKAISEGWDWKAVRTLAVSLRAEGTYAVMDGQQRLTAARECNILKLPCQVYIDLDEKKEAELFLKLNNSSKPTANDMFRAKLAEDDPEAKLIMMALNNTNWKLDLEPVKRGHKASYCSIVIGSATALTQIYRDGGVIHLQSVLNICHGWYGQHLAGSADILLGVSAFVLKHKSKIEFSRLTEKLANETPSGLVGKTMQLAAAQLAAGGTGGQGSRKRVLVNVLENIYNKGIKAANRIGV